MEFYKWWENSGWTAEEGYEETMAEDAWNASRKQAIDECIEIAESLSDKFYEDDQHKWSEMREDRSQGAASVMHKLKELKK